MCRQIGQFADIAGCVVKLANLADWWLGCNRAIIGRGPLLEVVFYLANQEGRYCCVYWL
jgi:hypothetical protein